MKDISSLDLGGNFSGSLLGMVLNAGIMVKFVLLILLIFSVVYWAIIFFKYRYYRNIKKENEAFSADYLKSSKLSEILPAAKKYKYSTTAEVFRVCYTELTSLTKSSKESSSAGDEIHLSSLDNVDRSLNRACNTEMTKLESSLGWIATTG